MTTDTARTAALDDDAARTFVRAAVAAAIAAEDTYERYRTASAAYDAAAAAYDAATVACAAAYHDAYDAARTAFAASAQ